VSSYVRSGQKHASNTPGLQTPSTLTVARDTAASSEKSVAAAEQMVAAAKELLAEFEFYFDTWLVAGHKRCVR
jgi:hypothetical protein